MLNDKEIANSDPVLNFTNFKSTVMKIITFITSVTLLLITGFYFIGDITTLAEFSDYLFKSIQVILMLICAIGITMNWPRKLLTKRIFKMVALPLPV